MQVFKKSVDITQRINKLKKEGKKIGFVPTMGALHEGHIALISKSVSENEITICSIFVNPTQFNNPSDFEKYPITIEKDMAMLIEAKCSILFLPNIEEMYPKSLKTNKIYNIDYLDTILEGKHRPGHFQGVCTIVHKLLEIINPNNLYMGAKDYQQCMVIKKLIELENIDVNLIICPTLRENSGLAMSSRNMRLSIKGKEKASTIYNCLNYIKTNQTTNWPLIKAYCTNLLLKNGLEPEYIEIANANNLSPLDNFDSKEPIVALIVAYCEGVRLIDNMVIR